MASSECLSFLLRNVWDASTTPFRSGGGGHLVVHFPNRDLRRHPREEKLGIRENENIATRVEKTSLSFPGQFLIINLSGEEDLEEKLDILVASSCPSSSWSPARLRVLKIHLLRSLLINLNFLRPPILPLLLQPEWAFQHWLQTTERQSTRQHSRSLHQPRAGARVHQRGICVGSSAFPPLECVMLSLLSWRSLLFSSVEVGAAHALGIHPSVAETACATLLASVVAKETRTSSPGISVSDSLCPGAERWRTPSRVQQETDGYSVVVKHRGDEGTRMRLPTTRKKDGNAKAQTTSSASCSNLPSAVHDILSSAAVPGTSHALPASLCPRVALMRAIAYWYCLEQLQLPDPWPSSADADAGRDRWMRPGKPAVSASLPEQVSAPGTPGSDTFSLSLVGSPSTGSTAAARGFTREGLSGTEENGTGHSAFGMALEALPVSHSPNDGFSGDYAAYENAAGIYRGRFRARERNTPSCGSRLLKQLQDSFDSAMIAVLERQHESLVQLRERQSTEMEEACGRREEHVAREASGCSVSGHSVGCPMARRGVGGQETGTVFPDAAASKKSDRTNGSAGDSAAPEEYANGAEEAPSALGTRETQGAHTLHTYQAENVGRNQAPAFGQSVKKVLGIAGDQSIIDRNREEAAAVEALVLQHVSEFELLELHWRAERALLKQQHLQDLKDVAIDLYLLHKAALEGHDSPLILPALPSAQESDMLPADWHSHYRPDNQNVDADLQQKDTEGAAHYRGSKSTGQVLSEGRLVDMSNWWRTKANEGKDGLGEIVPTAGPPVFFSTPVTTLLEGTRFRPTNAASKGEASLSRNGSRVIGAFSDSLPGTGAASHDHNGAFRSGAWQRQPHTLHPVLDIVTPTSLLRRFIEHRRRQQQKDAPQRTRKKLEERRLGEPQGVSVSSSRSNDTQPPRSRRHSYSDIVTRSGPVSREVGARQSRSSSSVLAAGMRPAPSFNHKGDGGNLSSSGTAPEKPIVFTSVVDVDALMGPAAWEAGLRSWPEENLLMRLKQHAVVPLMFGHQRKRSFVIRVCTGNVTDVTEHASSANAAGGQRSSGAGWSGVEERIPKKPDDSSCRSGTGASSSDRLEHSCGGVVDYLSGMTAVYDYHATECPSRAEFFWVDSVRSPLYTRHYCSDDVITGGPYPPRIGKSSGVDHAAGNAGVSSVTLSRQVPSSDPAIPTPLSSSAYAGQANSRGRASRQAASETEDHRGGHLLASASSRNGCSSFSLVGPTPSPLVAIVLPVTSSLKLQAPAYQQWRARTAAASDFVFPGIDEQHRMLDVYLSRRKAAQFKERQFCGILPSQQGDATAAAGQQGAVLSGHKASSPALNVGEIFVSRHSNNGGVSVVFHLVVSGTTSSRRSGEAVDEASPQRSQRNINQQTGSPWDITHGVGPTKQSSGVDSNGGESGVGQAERGERVSNTSLPERQKWDAIGDSNNLPNNESCLTPASARKERVETNQMDETRQWVTASVVEHDASLPCELQFGLKEILSVSNTTGIRTLVMPLLLMEGGTADCSLPFAQLQRRVFQVLRCVINELRSIADSSDRSPQLRQVVLVLPQQSQQHEAGKGVAREGDALAGDDGGECKAQDQRWIDGILKSTINFIRNSTHCCTLVK
ncbi:hypothetical protein TGRUB_230650 [Toxoplasma gondii RUB]|uniref:Uncharacterized protein n=1 Tax=Toxoplasma gondii RUB TaxID=935652 RepID=A0A086M3Z8_TOXGO|nr:hypothetical protein TGRUB_230650 [Toxoplasma gondii RUB]